MRIITLKILCSLIITTVIGVLFAIGFFMIKSVFASEEVLGALTVYVGILAVLYIISLLAIHIVPDEDYHHNP